MADLDPDTLAKVGGGGGLGAAVVLLLGKLFSRDERDNAAMSAKLDLVLKAQQDLANQLAVLADRASRTTSDVDGLLRAQAAQEARLIRVEERLEQMGTSLERCQARCGA